MWRNRLTLIIVLLLVTIGLSACYKDAGDNMQPTSNQVNLTDIAPVTPTQVVLPTPTPLPVTPTRTAIPSLVPTTTPANGDSVSAPSGDTIDPTQAVSTDLPPANQADNLQPAATNTPMQIAPSFTPAIAESPTPAGPVIETPGLSDIQASNTPPPTLDPDNLPTPTPIPVEDNPCIHVVQPSDTLYSIAQNNGVLLADLVAGNTDILWAGQDTMLQIGWELHIPGCSFGEPTPEPTTMADETGDDTQPTATPAPGEQIIHVVASGETIFSIGRLYGVDPYAIIEINGLVNPDVLQPGQELIIPAAQ